MIRLDELDLYEQDLFVELSQKCSEEEAFQTVIDYREITNRVGRYLPSEEWAEILYENKRELDPKTWLENIELLEAGIDAPLDFGTDHTSDQNTKLEFLLEQVTEGTKARFSEMMTDPVFIDTIAEKVAEKVRIKMARQSYVAQVGKRTVREVEASYCSLQLYDFLTNPTLYSNAPLGFPPMPEKESKEGWYPKKHE